MESAAVLRSLNYSPSVSSHLKSVIERPVMIIMNSAEFSGLSKFPVYGRKNVTSTNKLRAMHVSCVKTTETTETTETSKSNGDANGAVLSDNQKKKSPPGATFPNGFEALLTEVCDETEIAELKVKFGAFEIHMKRKINGPTLPAPVVAQSTAPPAPSKPATDSTPPTPPKPSSEKVNPFTNVCAQNAAKFAALDASGSSGYVIVSSPSVGSFRRARTLKGKKQPNACKEGDVIKEGQVIGYLDQFGTEFPVKSDVVGEVLKLLYNDGEAVGYGDPLIAVLPSFHGINLTK